jgi:maltooligosyltrehalose trehalohydrolase
MLFQGQEFAASGPFLYFADHKPALADRVRAGRAEFLDQWRSLSLRQLNYDNPCSRETFDRCKLDFSERKKHSETYALHRDLLNLRKTDAVLSRQDHRLDGEVLGPEAFVVRFFSEGYQDDRLLVVNLGTELRLTPSPMPLLGPPENCEWAVQWSSDDPKYGGNGTAPLDSDLNWVVPAHAAVVLRPVAKKSEQAKK